VVVGDLVSSCASQEQAIVGETPNLAARSQGIAEPNSLEHAEALVGNLFELEDLAAKDLKASRGRCELGRRCDPLQLRAGSRRCTPLE
jgi:hypothetical protein